MARDKTMTLQIRQYILQQGRTSFENCTQYHHLDPKYVADVELRHFLAKYSQALLNGPNEEYENYVCEEVDPNDYIKK